MATSRLDQAKADTQCDRFRNPGSNCPGIWIASWNVIRLLTRPGWNACLQGLERPGGCGMDRFSTLLLRSPLVWLLAGVGIASLMVVDRAFPGRLERLELTEPWVHAVPGLARAVGAGIRLLTDATKARSGTSARLQRRSGDLWHDGAQCGIGAAGAWRGPVMKNTDPGAAWWLVAPCGHPHGSNGRDADHGISRLGTVTRVEHLT